MIDIKTNISVTISDDEDYGTTYEILANKDDLNKLIDVILSLGNKKEAVLVKETNLKDDSKTLIIQRNDALDKRKVKEGTLKIKMEILEDNSIMKISSGINGFNDFVSLIKEGQSYVSKDNNLSLGIIFTEKIVSFLEPETVSIYASYSYISTFDKKDHSTDYFWYK